MVEYQQLLFGADQKRGQKPWVSAFLNGVLTCPAANKDHRLCTSLPCLTGPLLSVCLTVCLAGRLTDWLTEVSSDVPELICYNRPGRGQLCQHCTSAPRTADFFFIFYFFLHIPSFITGQRVSLTVLSGNERAEMLVEVWSGGFWTEKAISKICEADFYRSLLLYYCVLSEKLLCSWKPTLLVVGSRKTAAIQRVLYRATYFPFFFVVFGCIFFSLWTLLPLCPPAAFRMFNVSVIQVGSDWYGIVF